MGDDENHDDDDNHDDKTEEQTSDNEEKYDDEKAVEEPKDEEEEEEETNKENGDEPTDNKEIETEDRKSIRRMAGLDRLMVSALLDEGMSAFKVWLIMNAWSGDPEQYITLLGNLPVDATNANDGQSNENQMESQLAAHMDSAKSDMAETQT